MCSRTTDRRAAWSVRSGITAVFLVAASSATACGGPEVDPRTTSARPSSSTTVEEADSERSPWATFALGDAALEFETFGSLGSMVRTADVTVLATVTSGTFGDKHVYSEDGEEPMADIDMNLDLHVDEVLAGEVEDGSDTLTLVMGPYDVETVSKAPWKPLLGTQAVFTLRRAGTEVANEWGTRAADPQVYAENRYFVIYSKGLLDKSSNGRTRAPWAERSGWIKRVIRRPFNEVLASIRAADD